jgi:hypothetical protein
MPRAKIANPLIRCLEEGEQLTPMLCILVQLCSFLEVGPDLFGKLEGIKATIFIAIAQSPIEIPQLNSAGEFVCFFFSEGVLRSYISSARWAPRSIDLQPFLSG